MPSGREQPSAEPIRAERAEDFDAVRRLHEIAFAPSTDEVKLVDALRTAGATVPELCLVALDGNELIGHIMYSRARLQSGHEVLALAPMAVLPKRQRAGVGSRLVHASVERARRTDFPLAIVVGHPGYYPRFGFEPAGDLGLESPWQIPPEAWMALRLPTYEPDARGLVSYARAFEEVG